MKKTRLAFLTVALVGTALTVALVFPRNVAPLPSGVDTPSNAAVARTDQATTPEYVATTVAPSPTRVCLPRTADAMPVKSHVTPEGARALSDVFPGLSQRPRDWRNFDPARMDVRLFGDTVVPFDRVSYTTEGNRSVWVGRTPTVADSDEAWIVAVADEKGLSANISFAQGASFSVYAGQDAVVTEASAKPAACGQKDTMTEQVGSGAVTAAALNGVNYSDVAFLYDTDAENEAAYYAGLVGSGQTAQQFMENAVRAACDLANVYLSQSGVDNLAWRFAGIAKIPAYSIDGDKSMITDMNVIRDAIGEAGQYAKNYFAQQGADQLMLIVGGDRDYGGRGDQPGHHSVSVFWHGQFTAPNMAHELAHNFGCHHDRVTDGAADNNGQSYYGYTFTAAGQQCRTIMSYIGNGVTYFSNPEVTYEGVPTGIAAGQPKAANNAANLKAQAPAMAAYRTLPGAPVITEQPNSVSVTAGGSFTLRVTATGNNLTYAWSKGGNPIANANSASLTISNATSADAGTYTVEVKNDTDSVTSNGATVSVTTSTPTPPTGGGSGGGGGGGAPSDWFIGSLILLSVIRRLVKRNSAQP